MNELDAIELGKGQVEQQEIGNSRHRLDKSLLPVASGFHFIPGSAKHLRDCFPRIRVIFNV